MAQVAMPHHIPSSSSINGGMGGTSNTVTGSRNISLPSGAITTAPVGANVDNYMTNNTLTTTTTSPRAISGYETSTSYEQSRRHVSSVVVSEELLGPMPGSLGVKYVEVPVVEEVVRHVPKRTVVEVEKPIPKYEVEYVERIVEIPEVHYVDRHVDKVQVQEVVRTVPIKQVHEIPREIVRTVPKVEYVQVEKIIEVGQTVEVPKPYVVEQRVDVKRYVDNETPVVVAQTIRPVITEGNEVVDVDVIEYEPQVIPVDVHVAKPIPAQLLAVGASSEIHQAVTVPAAQYNTLLQSLNPHLGNDMEALPYLRENGSVTFLAPGESLKAVQPPPSTMIHPARTVNLNSGTVTSLGGGRPFTTTSYLSQQQQQQMQQQYRQVSAGGQNTIHHNMSYPHPSMAHITIGPAPTTTPNSNSPASYSYPQMPISSSTSGGAVIHEIVNRGNNGVSNSSTHGGSKVVSRGISGATITRSNIGGAPGDARSVKSERSGLVSKSQDNKARSITSPDETRKSIISRVSSPQTGIPVASTTTAHKRKACQC